VGLGAAPSLTFLVINNNMRRRARALLPSGYLVWGRVTSRNERACCKLPSVGCIP